MYGYNPWWPTNTCCSNDNGTNWVWIIIIIFVVLFIFRSCDCRSNCR